MEDYFEQDKPIAEITVQELDGLAKIIFAQRKVCEDIEKTLKNAQNLLARHQTKMMSILGQFNRSHYTIDGVGQLYMSERTSVTLPQTPGAKDEFYGYLKERGIFEELVTVNSMTLNAFWKREQEIAVKEERSIGFKIPGIDDPKTVVTLNMRKTR